MSTTKLADGVVHKMPADLRKVLEASEEASMLWADITPLARNEWICWVVEAKRLDTRKNRVDRVRDELIQGMRRPCCWIGCIHRVKNGKAVFAK